MEILLIAETYQSFHAIATLNQYAFENLYIIENLEEAESAIEKIFSRLNRLKLHGTPGYLNLAKSCIDIVNYYQQVLFEENTEVIKNLYQLAVQYAQTALLLEPNCSTSINNAYFGQGIEPGLIFNKKIIFKDLSSVVNECCNFARGYLSPATIDIAKCAAKIEADTFLKQVYPEIFKENLNPNTSILISKLR